MLVLEPIFEADLPSELYAYRPGRNAQQAVVEVEELLFRGHPEVVDADLADYFRSIPHAELLKSVSRRIVDRRVLHLIRMWLDCSVEETDDRGRRTRTTEARDKRRGIPQGSPLSPLLANIYMRRFVLGWKMFGLERSRDVCLLVGPRLCDRLDFAKLAAVPGVDPRNLKTMDCSAVFGATGWPPGAMGPFWLSAQTNVRLDEAIFRALTIYCGSRELNEVLETQASRC